MERDELLSEALRIGIECNESYTRFSLLFNKIVIAAHSKTCWENDLFLQSNLSLAIHYYY